MAKARFGGRLGRVVALALGFAMAGATQADATIQLGDLLLFGDISAQNLFRMREVGQFNLVQQRNTLRVGIDYKWLEEGKFIDKYDAPGFIQQSSIYMLYRGVYDSVYDLKPGGQFYNFQGDPAGSFSDIPLGARDALKWENVLREAYIDVDFADIPLSLRLGRQQIVWGETDNFRLLDRVNALDLTWHLQQEIEIGRGWDQLRIPYWMMKWLYRLDDVGPVSNAFLEGFWNPGDWYPNKRRFLPYSPWSLPLVNPIPEALSTLERGTVLFRQGDYTRNPADNSQVGVRFSGFTAGINFTMAYLYQRWAGDDGSNTGFLRADLDPTSANAALANGQLPAWYSTPYTHVFGVSGNYFEEHTEAVLKSEMVYILGAPFNDGDKRSPILPSQLFGISKRDMWQGVIGFDRPTWIRFLNPNATWLILGQFFWHYIIDNERPVGDQVGFVGNLSPGPPGTTTTPLVRRDGTPCVAAPFDGCKATDRVRDWEMLMTLAATSFYMSGTLVPQLTYVLDPVNAFNMEVAWSLDYYVTPDFIVNVAQKYFINTTEEPVYETWGVAGVNRGRSETQLRFTYQF
jgi:hypothetical protein